MDHFSAVFRTHFPALYNFVRREIAYHATIGDLGPDDLTPDDVVGAVAVRAQREFMNMRQSRDLRGWLIQLAIQELKGEVTRLSRERARVLARVEEDIPETPPAGTVSTFGDIARALAELPSAWRSAFVLRYVEDLPVAEVARIVRGTAEDVERQLEGARDWLRLRLAQAGFTPQDREIEMMFGTAHEMDVPAAAHRAVDETLRLQEVAAQRAVR